MNPVVKAKWVAALRSGEYEQTTHVLQDATGFCCLGVLCDLYRKESHDGQSIRSLAEEGDELPGEIVVEWAGLSNNDPRVLIEDRRVFVSHHNDGHYGIPPASFAAIADAIEEQL